MQFEVRPVEAGDDRVRLLDREAARDVGATSGVAVAVSASTPPTPSSLGDARRA